MNSMKRSSGQFPSVRNMDRRELSELTGSECKINDLASSQSEIAKKIKQKIRQRRVTASEKKIIKKMETEKMIPGYEQEDRMCENQQCSLEDLKEQMESLWENSQEIYSAIVHFQKKVDPVRIKAKIFEDWSLIVCQVAGGQQLEAILINKIKKICELEASTKKCSQKEETMKNMFDERLKKLQSIIKSR